MPTKFWQILLGLGQTQGACSGTPRELADAAGASVGGDPPGGIFQRGLATCSNPGHGAVARGWVSRMLRWRRQMRDRSLKRRPRHGSGGHRKAVAALRLATRCTRRWHERRARYRRSCRSFQGKTSLRPVAAGAGLGPESHATWPMPCLEPHRKAWRRPTVHIVMACWALWAPSGEADLIGDQYKSPRAWVAEFGWIWLLRARVWARINATAAFGHNGAGFLWSRSDPAHGPQVARIRSGRHPTQVQQKALLAPRIAQIRAL